MGRLRKSSPKRMNADANDNLLAYPFNNLDAITPAPVRPCKKQQQDSMLQVASRNTDVTISQQLKDITEESYMYKDLRRPRQLLFFRNGDHYFRGKRLRITPNRFQTFDNLLSELTKHMSLPYGVRKIYHPESGKSITDIENLIDGGSYVCASFEKFKKLQYETNHSTPDWSTGHTRKHSQLQSDLYGRFSYSYPSTGKYAAAYARSPAGGSESLEKGVSGPVSFTFPGVKRPPLSHREPVAKATGTLHTDLSPVKPKLCKIVKSGTTPRQSVSLLLNKRSVQSFEMLVQDISDAFGLPKYKNHRVRKLFTIDGKEVKGVADFFRNPDDVFIASASKHPLTGDEIAEIYSENFPGNPYAKSHKRRTKGRDIKSDSGIEDDDRGEGLTIVQAKKAGRKSKDAEKVPKDGGDAARKKKKDMEAEEGNHQEDDLRLKKDEQKQRKEETESEEGNRKKEEQKKKREEVEREEANKTKEVQKKKREETEREEANRKKEEQLRLKEEELKKREDKLNKQFLEDKKKTEKDRLEAVTKNEAELKAKEEELKRKEEVEQRKREEEEEKKMLEEDEENQRLVEFEDKMQMPEDDTGLFDAQDLDQLGDEYDNDELHSPEVVDDSTSNEINKTDFTSTKNKTDFTSDPRDIVEKVSILSRYTIGSKIGDGNFADVHEATQKDTEQVFAMKIVDKSKLHGKEHMIENEIGIMKNINHPNIVKLFEEHETRQHIYLVMEYIKGGDLFDAITESVKFTEADAAVIISNMSSALAYLHSLNIVHRDLKPENLLVNKSSSGDITLKLADFGLAMEVKAPIFTVCGTPTYVAPEILTETGYGREVDMWATGVICYILLCGFPPFRSLDRDQEELFQLIQTGDFVYLSPYWDSISDDAKDLIDHLLVVSRRKRYTAKQVLAHPWVISSGGRVKETLPNLQREVSMNLDKNFEGRKSGKRKGIGGAR